MTTAKEYEEFLRAELSQASRALQYHMSCVADLTELIAHNNEQLSLIRSKGAKEANLITRERANPKKRKKELKREQDRADEAVKKRERKKREVKSTFMYDKY